MSTTSAPVDAPRVPKTPVDLADALSSAERLGLVSAEAGARVPLDVLKTVLGVAAEFADAASGAKAKGVLSKSAQEILDHVAGGSKTPASRKRKAPDGEAVDSAAAAASGDDAESRADDRAERYAAAVEALVAAVRDSSLGAAVEVAAELASWPIEGGTSKRFPRFVVGVGLAFEADLHLYDAAARKVISRDFSPPQSAEELPYADSALVFACVSLDVLNGGASRFHSSHATYGKAAKGQPTDQQRLCAELGFPKDVSSSASVSRAVYGLLNTLRKLVVNRAKLNLLAPVEFPGSRRQVAVVALPNKRRASSSRNA